MSPANTQAAQAALSGVRPVLAHFNTPRSAEDLAADIIDLWTGVERSLQALIGTSSLSGQQLIRAARQAEVITIDQAHSLLEFLAARDRANRTSYKPTQADGDAAEKGYENHLDLGVAEGAIGGHVAELMQHRAQERADENLLAREARQHVRLRRIARTG